MENIRDAQSAKGVIAILISTLGFALYPILGKFVFAGGAGLATVLFMRFLIGTIIFWIIILSTEGIPHLTKKNFIALCLLGGLGYAGQAGLYLSAVQRIPASMAVLLLYVYPILVTILALVGKQEKLSLLKVTGLLSSTLGLILVLGLTIQGINLSGTLFALGAATVYAIYILASNRLLRTVSPLLSSAVITSSACLTYGMAVIFQGFSWNLSVSTWFEVIGIALFSTVIAILTFFYGLQKVGPTTASILSTLEPVMTVLLALFFLGERLNPIQTFGAVFVVLGATMAAWPTQNLNIAQDKY